jgi:hypothetical protein
MVGADGELDVLLELIDGADPRHIRRVAEAHRLLALVGQVELVLLLKAAVRVLPSPVAISATPPWCRIGPPAS